MRDLKRSDLPDLQRILEETKAFTDAEVDCAMELFHTVLDNPAQKDYIVVVAEEGGLPAGYILYGPVPLTEGTFDIYWIATDPAHQGRGVGQRLLLYAETDIQLRGGRLVCLETSSQGSYERTRRFYDRAGYVQAAVIPDFYRPGDDRITYIKNLTTVVEGL
ncbi:MAG: N-acetyltransferase [Desulfuromonadales bacterium]|nr:N-acetyltransferase [Desulfuromonadales bacterium]MDW7756864.1 N-acetyltransferase [Desulfuromonadales bacterium]